MSSEFQLRPITRVPFKALGKIDTLHIEKLVIVCDKTIDIGAWCYRRRAKKSTLTKGKAVDLSTFDNTRRKKLKALIDCLFDSISHLSEAAQGDHTGRLMYFLNWSDENGHYDVLENKSSTRNVYKIYCNMLRDRCDRNKLKSSTAAKYQFYILRLFRELYNDSLFGEGIRLFTAKSSQINHIQVQSESDQAKIVAWCHAIFDGFSDFVLDEKTFPFQVTIPQQQNWEINSLWVFPTTTMVMTPDTLSRRGELKHGHWVYDYANGKLNSKEDIENYYRITREGPDQFFVRIFDVAKKRISDANNNRRHYQRKRLATVASLAFLHLLYAYSGQNSTPIQAMRWPNDYKISAERQGFRVIKNRGHKGQILFELQNRFLPTFRKYLKLRKWLLKDSVDSDFLFFSIGANLDQEPHCWSKPTEAFKSRLKSIGVKLPPFGARQFRANKIEYSNTHADLATAAKAADHSIDTHLSSYMSGSRSKHAGEMSEFFSAVRASSSAKQLEKRTEIGGCDSIGNPEQLQFHTTIPPNCGQPEGCLSCKHFFVHADEEDIRKLASGRYVIEKTRHLANSPEHYKILFEPVFERIVELLAEIGQRSDELQILVERVVREVTEEEILSEFWASELRYLLELELVNE